MSDALETRLAAALDARAALKRVDASAMEHRRALVHAAVEDGVVGLDVDDDGLDVSAGSAWRPDITDRPRQHLLLLLAAAAVAALVLAGIGLVHRAERPALPAAGGQAAFEQWRGMFDLDRDQRPEDLEGLALISQGVMATSVRSIAELGAYRYWAGWTRGGGLCWAVLSPSGQAEGCNSLPSRTEPQEISDGTNSPALYLLPGEQPDTTALEARGFIALTPNVMVDADALGSAEDLFSRLRSPQVATDALAADGPAINDPEVLSGSVRRLAEDGSRSFYIATTAKGEVCLFIVAGDVTGGTRSWPVLVATQGVYLRTDGPSGSTTAWLAADNLDTSGWPALGRREITPNLWLEEAGSSQLRVQAPSPR